MQLEAHVQGHFPFAGVKRKPGDVISATDLAKTTPQQRDALVNSKLIVLALEGAPTDPDERYQHLLAIMERQSADIVALQAAQNTPTPELIAAIQDVVREAVHGATAKPTRTARKPRGRRSTTEAI